MRRLARPCQWLLLMALLCSCNYLKNRANDVFDVFRFDVGWGPGLYAGVRVTDFVGTGLGYRYMDAAGLHGRFIFTSEIGSIAAVIFIVDQPTHPNATPLLPGDTSRFDRWAMVAAPLLGAQSSQSRGNYAFMRRGLRLTDVSVGITLGYVGADIGVSPGEFLDLLLGFVGIDLAGDDVFGREPRPDAAAPPRASAPDLLR